MPYRVYYVDQNFSYMDESISPAQAVYDYVRREYYTNSLGSFNEGYNHGAKADIPYKGNIVGFYWDWSATVVRVDNIPANSGLPTLPSADYPVYSPFPPPEEPPLKLFTTGRDSVNFNSLTPEQKQAIEKGFNLYNAHAENDDVTLPNTSFIPSTAKTWNPAEWFYGESGNDTITGGDLNDRIDGGEDNDRIDGGEKDDELRGGAGSDLLEGGAGTDTIDGGSGGVGDIFDGDTEKSALDYARASGARRLYTFTPLTAPKDGETPSVRMAGPDGTDTLENIERVAFDNGFYPIVKWHFVITRSQDGNAKLSFYENGQELTRKVKAWYDDATPIPEKTSYEAIYRTNGGVKGWADCIELADNDTGKPEVAGRTAIQIHGGSSPQSSEGCIVLTGPNLRPIIQNYIREDLAATYQSQFAWGQLGYQALPIPITVEVRGDVKQPKIGFASDVSLVEGQAKTASLVMVNDGIEDGVSKAVNLTLKVSEGKGCTYGVDWEFTGKALSFDKAKGKFTQVDLDKLYNEKSDSLDVVFAPKTDKLSLGITALTDKGKEAKETLSFSIQDLDIIRQNSGGKWELHNDSKSASATPTGTEKLLLGSNTDLTVFIIDKGAKPAPNKKAVSETAADDVSDNTFWATVEDEFFTFSGEFGRDQVVGFKAGAGVGDVIAISKDLLRDFEDVMAHASQHEARGVTYTAIKANAEDKIILRDVTLASLHQDDFAFV